MADSTENITADKPVKVKETTKTAKTTEKVEATYPLKDFRDNSKALGYTKEVVAGALFNCSQTELTKTEFEKIIKNFLGKKVK